MPVMGSTLDTRSAAYRANREAALESLAAIQELHEKVRAGGGPKYTARHAARGKLGVRERIDLLLDRDSPFLEIGALAGWGSDDPLGGGIVTGIGVVCGVECVVSANDPTVKGGSQSPTSVTRVLRALEVASVNRLPFVSLTESGGADLAKQADLFVPGGAVFAGLARLSQAGIPTLTVVLGSATAGGAYLPGLSDHTVLVADAARVFLGGPPLVKMAIDEDVDEETLGGARMHATTSGLADGLALDERDSIRQARAVVRSWRYRKAGPGPTESADDPIHDPDELLGVAPADTRTPLPIREVIARVLDGSRFDEFKAGYGSRLVCGWGSIHGFPVGVIANDGVLFSAESQKGAHFIQLANRRDTPLVFLQNITGFMVGTRAEHGGIVKHGSMLVNAVSTSKVPHITMMVGASYGAGNYGMSGRAFDPRLLFTWPNHRIAVMGGTQLAGVMEIVQRTAAERAGREWDPDQGALARMMAEGMVDAQSTALFATGRLWDDGIIDPRSTRDVVGAALSASHSAPVQGATGFGVFRM